LVAPHDRAFAARALPAARPRVKARSQQARPRRAVSGGR
jgi:hypothetical protein